MGDIVNQAVALDHQLSKRHPVNVRGSVVSTHLSYCPSKYYCLCLQGACKPMAGQQHRVLLLLLTLLLGHTFTSSGTVAAAAEPNTLVVQYAEGNRAQVGADRDPCQHACGPLPRTLAVNNEATGLVPGCVIVGTVCIVLA